MEILKFMKFFVDLFECYFMISMIYKYYNLTENKYLETKINFHNFIIYHVQTYVSSEHLRAFPFQIRNSKSNLILFLILRIIYETIFDIFLKL